MTASQLYSTEQFENDAIDIWWWIAAHDPRAADRLLEKVYRRCQLLVSHPLAGPGRADIDPHCRMLVIAPCIVLYRVEDTIVTLVRLLDGRRDIAGADFSGG